MTDTPLDHIRNFAIIAHIDHGKSTLADRLIQVTGALTDREMTNQVLDNMDLERERGITIKAQTVRLTYKANDGETYTLNLMDTPGHVDFAYEVSRSLAACEGSILVVDASQGVEAQTLANVYQAIDQNHEIVPVLNKVDLPSADADRVKQQIEDVIGIDASGAIPISAKTGKNVAAVLEAIVERLPAPKGDRNAPLKALLIDSWYDAYLGVVVLVRVIHGALKKGQKIKLMSSDATHQVERGVAVGHRLRLHALAGVHNQHRTFAGSERARDFVGEVDMPRRVHQVELIDLAVLIFVVEAHGLRLDGDAALPLDVHRVEDLRLHIPVGDIAAQLDQPVRQGRLAVIDVGDDRKIANETDVRHGPVLSIAGAPIKQGNVYVAANSGLLP